MLLPGIKFWELGGQFLRRLWRLHSGHSFPEWRFLCCFPMAHFFIFVTLGPVRKYAKMLQNGPKIAPFFIIKNFNSMNNIQSAPPIAPPLIRQPLPKKHKALSTHKKLKVISIVAIKHLHYEALFYLVPWDAL